MDHAIFNRVLLGRYTPSTHLVSPEFPEGLIIGSALVPYCSTRSVKPVRSVRIRSGCGALPVAPLDRLYPQITAVSSDYRNQNQTKGILT